MVGRPPPLITLSSGVEQLARLATNPVGRRGPRHGTALRALIERGRLGMGSPDVVPSMIASHARQGKVIDVNVLQTARAGHAGDASVATLRSSPCATTACAQGSHPVAVPCRGAGKRAS